jgi:hypothetical protein
MTEQPTDAVVERFPPTNGRFSGILGLVTAAVIFVLALVAGDTGRPVGVAIGAVLGAIVCWAALLRPAVWVTHHNLVLRGMFHTDLLPLAAIDRVVITQVLVVGVGGKRYVSPTVGYSARQTVMVKRLSRLHDPQSQVPETPQVRIKNSPQMFVEERIRLLAQDSREQRGIVKGSPEQAALAAGVRRTYAWPEIAGVAVCVVAFAVWLVL